MKLTKEKVLKNLEDIVRFGGLTMSSEFVESVKIAMEAYEQEPCEDCISRQTAIKAIWDGTNMDIYTSEVKEILEGLPPVQPKAKTEWSPISFRPLTEEEKEEYPGQDEMYDCPLPCDGQEVLVTTYSGDVHEDVFCRDDGCYFENYCDPEDVTAWMPKPKPYKENEE